MKIQNPFIALVIIALPTLVQAQFSFITNSGAISITSYTGTNGAVVIPASTNGYPVTTIWGDAFSSILTSVGIPGSITNISTYTFSYCSSLTNITVDMT